MTLESAAQWAYCYLYKPVACNMTGKLSFDVDDTCSTKYDLISTSWIRLHLTMLLWLLSASIACIAAFFVQLALLALADPTFAAHLGNALAELWEDLQQEFAHQKRLAVRAAHLWMYE